MLSSGAVLSDRYVLEERVAAGGMGEVWRALDELLQRRVAVKVLLPYLLSDAEFITRFRTEARMMAAVRHPGIAQVYDCGEDVMPTGQTVDYLVMEFVDGTPLSTWIDTDGPRDPRQTMTILAQAADALQVAHDAGIVHRDVKPSNLLVRPGGGVVLVDFGVARSTATTSLTGTNVVLGTAHYMAPEQAEGKPVTPATDVYALGAVAYCCLTGRPPYMGEGPLQVLTQLVCGEPPTLPPDVPPQVAHVVLRAMDKDPARRFPSAAALARAARAALDGGRTNQPPAPPSRTMPPAARTVTYRNQFAAPVPAAIPPAPLDRTGMLPASGMPAEAPVRRGRRAPATIALLLIVAGIGITAWAATSVLHPKQSSAETLPTHTVRPPGKRPATTRPATGHQPATTGPARNGSTPISNPSPTPPRSATPSPPDEAKPPPVSPRKLCGPKFREVDAAPLRSAGTVLGHVHLLVDRATGTGCVVTVGTAGLALTQPTTAFLEVAGSPRTTDANADDGHAGPVRATIGSACFQWGGSVNGTAFDSPPQQCG